MQSFLDAKSRFNGKLPVLFALIAWGRLGNVQLIGGGGGTYDKILTKFWSPIRLYNSIMNLPLPSLLPPFPPYTLLATNDPSSVSFENQKTCDPRR